MPVKKMGNNLPKKKLPAYGVKKVGEKEKKMVGEAPKKNG